MLSVIGRNWVGSRFDGRNDGSRARCACSSADGEMRGIAWGGMEMWLFVWEEAVVAIECSLPVVASDRTLNSASHLFFGLYVGVYQKLPDSAPSTLISGTIAYRGDRTHQSTTKALNIPRVRYQGVGIPTTIVMLLAGLWLCKPREF
jgi:hypothetical protein